MLSCSKENFHINQKLVNKQEKSETSSFSHVQLYYTPPHSCIEEMKAIARNCFDEFHNLIIILRIEMNQEYPGLSFIS